MHAGRKWHEELHKSQPEMVPHTLPDLERLDEMLHDLPLAVRSFVDEKEFYNAVAAVPPGYSFAGAPVRLRVRGLFALVSMNCKIGGG